ncbi:MAG TPA: 1-(5-phosphoribosyl)-5-[(5-phosphoribosylamino)methylideneamino]imidazole-4-carboxamide isomerase [Acidimicrobiales bacterium]|jgi:phosphoribosylformimino-5-aminoimidazole carboxamide ribotide isomerase
MNLYAAIDLLGGRCVRLHQGDYDRATDYGDDPVGQARRFAADGAPWIHVVDLDGARRGEPVNHDVIGRIAAAVDVPVQVGGGVRSRPDAEALWAAGVARVVMGTAALEDPDLVAALVPDGAVAVGLDARGRELAVRGWEAVAGVDLLEAVARFSALGVAALVVTEIGRDGTLDGPDLTGLSSVLEVATVPVVASGGVGSADDLVALTDLDLDGVIVGRALYDDRVTVAEAVAVLAP